MDIFKKRDEIINGKKTVPQNNVEILNYVVYFINGSDDIVYIGRKRGALDDVDEYVRDNAYNRMADYYYAEPILDEDVEDAHAHRILMFQPFGNKNVTGNNKFISHNKAKEDYRIGKREFMKFWKERGGYQFNALAYVNKSDLLNEFGISGPYDKNMPRTGDTIIYKGNKHWDIIGGAAGIYNFLHGGWQEINQEEDENGIVTTIIKEKWPSYEERAERLEDLLSNANIVVSVLNSTTFIAEHTTNKARKTCHISDLGSLWRRGPSAYEQLDFYAIMKEKEMSCP